MKIQAIINKVEGQKDKVLKETEKTLSNLASVGKVRPKLHLSQIDIRKLRVPRRPWKASSFYS